MKQPLALCPGLLCDARLWEHQARHLADIAEPHIGDFTALDSIAAMARSVLAGMRGTFAIAGLSMGGYVAMEVMRQAPERVTRLCLLDTSARPDTEQQTAIMNRVDSRPSLGAIECPTLVLCGRQDALTPVAMAEEIAQGIPGAKLEIVEDCGHMSTMERPERVTALMRRWLEARG